MPETVYNSWNHAFIEEGQQLCLSNGGVSLWGKIAFSSEGNQWKIVRSRDGVPDRIALLDPSGNVQGYLVFIAGGNKIELLFYHRSAQNYRGEFTFEGTLAFPADGFSCITRPRKGERVISFSLNAPSSPLHDSLFSPQRDLLLRTAAERFRFGKNESGAFTFKFAGNIEEAAEAGLAVTLEEHYFKNRYVPYYHPLDRGRCPAPPAGWMSWNTYFDKAAAEDNLAEARIGQKELQPFGCEIWSIESWQGNSDELPVSKFYNMDLEVNQEQFPLGMKRLAGDIRALGFKPGIWIPPWGTGSEEFYKTHRDWFLHDQEGKPIPCWNGKYTLDPTAAEAREHLKRMFRTASKEWGYEFFKIDGMSGRSHGLAAHFYERPEIRARFRDPSCPNPFELCVKAFREGIGDDRIFLACQGHATGPESLYADAARIGADIVHPNEPVRWENVLNQGRCFLNQSHTHGIVMTADPDTLLVKDLTAEEARVSAAIIALPGQLTFFGDKLAGLSREQMNILRQTLPAFNVFPEHLYPFFSMLPVWNLRIGHKVLGNYNTAAFFNWEDKRRTISVEAGELGLDKSAVYTAYEFWTGKTFSWNGGVFSLEVPPHGVRITAIHRETPFPQWLGSDRHISLSGPEVSSWKWNGETGKLTDAVKCVGGFPLTTAVRVPGSLRFAGLECKNAEGTAREDGGVLKISILSGKTGDVPFTLAFGKQ
ncbi:MAG: alpha-galactosidase [Treponema sp.]|jgi:hypothetical protein|nr:alpha-galactosidase [Treponema sp.]